MVNTLAQSLRVHVFNRGPSAPVSDVVQWAIVRCRHQSKRRSTEGRVLAHNDVLCDDCPVAAGNAALITSLNLTPHTHQPTPTFPSPYSHPPLGARAKFFLTIGVLLYNTCHAIFSRKHQTQQNSPQASQCAGRCAQAFRSQRAQDQSDLDKSGERTRGTDQPAARQSPSVAADDQARRKSRRTSPPGAQRQHVFVNAQRVYALIGFNKRRFRQGSQR